MNKNDTHCTICNEYAKTKDLPIYTIGSEGTQICEKCEMYLIEFLRNLRSLSNRSRLNVIKKLK